MSESILIVDDEQPMRRMLRRLLEGLNYSISEAESAEEALDALENASADLVITDLRMPGMDGLELAQRLLAREPDRPVLLMTAYADLESARRSVRVGIYEYFAKPFDVNDVAAGVKRALEHRRLVLENRAYQKDLERLVEDRTRELQEKLLELEARDELLRAMLSLREPEGTLGLSVKLALGLCNCDAGALYMPVPEAGVALRAAVGFAERAAPVAGEDRQRLEREGISEVETHLRETLKHLTPSWGQGGGPVRAAFGIHSFGILPVCRGEEAIAALEVCRKRKDALVGEADLEALEGFLPYVAMAVLDCRLQEDLPGWEGDVEEMLKATEAWSEE